jgi:hypothetical protein
MSPDHEEAKERQGEQNLQDLHASSHPLANGISQAILGVTEVKSQVVKLVETIGSMNITVNNLHKVIAGDPVFHIDGIIQNQATNQAAALLRHEQVMNKITEIESKRIKSLEDQMLSLKTYLKVWGIVATGLLGAFDLILRYFGK